MYAPLVFILFLALVAFSQGNPYCEMESCEFGNHTLCLFYEDWGPHENCGEGAVQIAMDPRHKLGIERGFEFNIHLDPELEIIAQRWADQCDWYSYPCNDATWGTVVTFGVSEEYDTPLDYSAMFQTASEWFLHEDTAGRFHNRYGCGQIDMRMWEILYVVCIFGFDSS